jgi:POT family proton-dependent oligopeptide transporter
MVLAAALFLVGSKRYVKTPPDGSAIIDTARTISIAISERGFENAKPSKLREHGHDHKYSFAQSPSYTDSGVDKVRTGVTACKFFVFLPLYFISWIQIWNNLISQAGTMALHGTPNDLLQNLDPIALIIFIPLLDFGIYPLLRRWRINFRPVVRIALGFIMVAVVMAYAAVLQHYIYISPPNSIHVWIQAPAYILTAFSEAFVFVTGMEIAFTKAPESLRSLVMALFWLTLGIGAAICISLTPVTKDPEILWMYTSLGVVSFVAGVLFYFCFRNSFGEEVQVLVAQEGEGNAGGHEKEVNMGKAEVV